MVSATNSSFRRLRDEILLLHLRHAIQSRPTYSVKEIAAALGYRSARSFARSIRRSCGMTPQDLRRALLRPTAANERIETKADKFK